MIQSKKIPKSAFGNKHLKLIMSDGRLSLSHSIPFLYGDRFGGYIKQFFFPIGKYFKENPSYCTYNLLFFCRLKC